MDKSRYINIACLIVTILSAAYAVYANNARVHANNARVHANNARKELSDYIRAQNWHLYSKANNASGHVLDELNKYKEISPDCMNHEVLESLSKADAISQDVFRDLIRQIQFSEPVFNSRAIKRWTAEGRVKAQHAPFFEILTPANQSLERDGPEAGP